MSKLVLRNHKKVNYSQKDSVLGRIPRRSSFKGRIVQIDPFRTIWAELYDKDGDLNLEYDLDVKPLTFTAIGRVDDQCQLFCESLTGDLGYITDDVLLKRNCYWEIYADLLERNTAECTNTRFSSSKEIKSMSLNDKNKPLFAINDKICYMAFISNQNRVYRGKIKSINLHTLCGQTRGEYEIEIQGSNRFTHNPNAMSLELKPYKPNMQPWNITEVDIILTNVQKSIECENYNYIKHCSLTGSLPLCCMDSSAFFGKFEEYNDWEKLIKKNWLLCVKYPFYAETKLIVKNEMNYLLNKTFSMICKFEQTEQTHNTRLNKTNIIKYAQYTSPYQFDFRYKILLKKYEIEFIPDPLCITFKMNERQMKQALNRDDIIEKKNNSRIILTSDVNFKFIRAKSVIIVHSFKYKSQNSHVIQALNAMSNETNNNK